jgi:hypothetical protein
MYDELLDAVRGRVHRFAETGDAEDVLDPAGVRDVRSLLEAAPRPGLGRSRQRWRDAQHAAGLLFYARYLASAKNDEELVVATPLLQTARDHVQGLDDQLQTLNAGAQRSPASNGGPVPVVVTAALMQLPLSAIDDSIAELRRALRARPLDDALPNRMNLADVQLLRFERTGTLEDLDAAIATVRGVLDVTPPDHPNYPGRISKFGLLLQTRFGGTRDASELDASVEAMRTAAAGTPEDHEDYAMHLSNLGRALLVRYQQVSADPADLDASREAMLAAVAATRDDEPTRGTRLNALSHMHLATFGRTGDPSEIDAAIAVGHAAVSVTKPVDQNYYERLLDVSGAHLLRYERSGDPNDLAMSLEGADHILTTLPNGHPLREVAQAIRAHAREATRRRR